MDRRVVKTKAAIEKAFFQLLAKKGNKVTVSEIARIADIDRKTFYLHYESVDDIIKEFCLKKVEEFMEELQTSSGDGGVNMHMLFQTLSQIIDQNIELLQLVSVSENKKYFFDQISRYLIESVTETYGTLLPFNEAELLVFSEFYISGIVSTYERWLDKKLPVSQSELATMITDACVKGLDTLLKERK